MQAYIMISEREQVAFYTGISEMLNADLERPSRNEEPVRRKSVSTVADDREAGGADDRRAADVGRRRCYAVVVDCSDGSSSRGRSGRWREEFLLRLNDVLNSRRPRPVVHDRCR